MWLIGSTPPRKPVEPCAEKQDHSERLHQAIKQASKTNVKMLENTTSRSLDQLEEAASIIQEVKRIVSNISVDANVTAEDAAKLVSRNRDENNR